MTLENFYRPNLSDNRNKPQPPPAQRDRKKIFKSIETPPEISTSATHVILGARRFDVQHGTNKNQLAFLPFSHWVTIQRTYIHGSAAPTFGNAEGNEL